MNDHDLPTTSTVDLSGYGLAIAAAAFVLITLGWWFRLLYHTTYTAPEDLALPLAFAFVTGIFCTAAVTCGGRQ